MLGMFLEVGVIHYDVIQVYKDEAVEKLVENLIHKCAECGWCIGKAKWRNLRTRRIYILSCMPFLVHFSW